MLYQGQVIGFRVTNNGSGYLPGNTSCTITGDGTGATATVSVGTPIQTNRSLRLLTPAGVTVRQSGAVMTQANATLRDLTLTMDTAVQFIESGGIWLVAGFYPAALLQSAPNGSVVLTSPTGATLSLAPGSGGNLLATNLPTSAAGLPAGAIWQNGNVLNIV
jgi:hypothetical protein